MHVSCVTPMGAVVPISPEDDSTMATREEPDFPDFPVFPDFSDFPDFPDFPDLLVFSAFPVLGARQEKWQRLVNLGNPESLGNLKSLEKLGNPESLGNLKSLEKLGNPESHRKIIWQVKHQITSLAESADRACSTSAEPDC